MSDSAQEVLHELTSAGLLSSDHATRYGAEIETGTDALLKRLVQDGHITDYQARKFREGKASDIYFGDYVVIDKLGQGGMGTVLLARHRRMDRQVAIKILPVTVLESKDAVARFYQEVKVAAQLTHPNIVVAYDAGEHHGFHYLVMEYVPGHDLAEVLSQLGPIPIPMVLDYVGQAAKGLDYAHRKGIVHRDIKPSNLLLNDEGDIKILDMGLARLGNTINQETTQLTTTGQVMGTVEYMSPEQAEDTRQADERSDIYSLGCTMYRLLTGRSPYSRDTVVKTILAHRSDAIPKIETGFPEDASVNELFRKMVAKLPEDRFQTTSALIEAIRKLEQGDSSSDSEPNLRASSAAVRGMAVVERFDSRESIETLPEAIIPTRQSVSTNPARSLSNVEYISNDDIETVQRPTAGQGFGAAGGARPNSNSEVIYIPDVVPPRGRLRRARQWIKADRSRGIMLWSVIALLLSWFPVVGLVVAWFTWRAANQDIRDMRQGKRNPKQYRLTWTGKYLSILATISSLVGLIMTFAGQNPFVQ